MNRIAAALGFLVALPASAAGPPVIDGSLDDPFWTVDAREWITTDARVPGAAARFLFGYDDANLYLAADIVEPDAAASRPSEEVPGGRGDAAWFYLDFGDGTGSGWTERCYAIALSPAPWARAIQGPNREQVRPPPEYKVQPKPGTGLHEGSGPNAGYVAEARIPLSGLGFTRPLAPDATVGVRFVCRSGVEGEDRGRLSTLADGAEGPDRWQRIRLDWRAPFAIRGWVERLPLPDAHDPVWRWYAPIHDDVHGPWLNRRRWTDLLDAMRKWRLNALLLEHPDAGGRLLAGAGEPDEGLVARDQQQLNWLLEEARSRGIRVYLTLGGPSRETPSSRPAGPALPPGPDTSRVAELLRISPGLAGLVLNVDGRLAPHVAFARAVAELLRAEATNAGTSSGTIELLFAARGFPPAIAQQIVGRYPRTRLLHDFQPGPWASPMLDPNADRLAALSSAGRGSGVPTSVSSVAIGGPGSASEYLFWGDPEWVRTSSLSLRRAGFDGMFFRAAGEENWLAAEAWGAYGTQPGDAYSPLRWQKRLREVYEVGEHAGQLLQAMQHASAIVPRFTSLVCNPSERYMPQLGLPLIAYVGLPTASEYRLHGDFPPAPGFKPAGRTMAPWREHVVGVAAEAAGQAPAGATTPDQVAERIAEHAAACRSLLTGLVQVQAATPDASQRLTAALKRLEMLAALGDHFQHRVQAAAMWQRFSAGRGLDEGILPHLRKSLTAWDAFSLTAMREHRGAVGFWELQMVSPPPWNLQVVQRHEQFSTASWRDRTAVLQREFQILSQSISMEGADARMPTWDQVDAQARTGYGVVLRLRFDAREANRYQLSAGAIITEDPAVALNGGSLMVDTRGLGPGWHSMMITDPLASAIPAGRAMQIMLDYRVMQRGQADLEPFRVSVRPDLETEPVNTQARWGAPDGFTGKRYIPVPPADHPGYVLTFDVLGEAVVVVDDLWLTAEKAG